MLSIAIQYALALYLLFLFVESLRSYYKEGLRSIPGPFLARLTRFWRIFFVWDGKAPENYYRLHQKYGPVVRTGPASVDISDPRAIPIIYGITTNFLKSDFYPFQTPEYEGTLLPNMFTEVDPAIHKAFKQPVASKFSMTSIKKFEPYVDQCTDVFFEQMHKRQGQAIDLSDWAQYYAFDTMGAITFQYQFGFMEQGLDVDSMMKKITFVFTYLSIVGQVPELHLLMFGNRPLLWLLAKLGMGGSEGGPLARIIEITEQRIAAYDNEAKDAERGDFLSWLRTEAEKGSGRMSYRDVFAHLSTNLIAGSDTTAIGLRSAFYFLVKNPRCYAKLVEEIDAAEHDGKLSGHITYDECLNLPYLQAVMKESLRVHPGIGFPLERVVPQGGANICGHRLPGGTIVGMNAHTVHRNKDIYGEDAEEFRPERWIDASPEHLSAMERSFLAFGHGTRTCIGKNISIMEIGKFVPQVLRHFDLEWASDKPEWNTECYWMYKQAGLIITFKPRKK